MPDDVWWLGGDFLHFMDLGPAMAARSRAIGLGMDDDEVYRGC